MSNSGLAALKTERPSHRWTQMHTDKIGFICMHLRASAAKFLCIAGDCRGVLCAPFPCGALLVAALTEGLQRLGGDAVGLAPFADGRAHVRGEGFLQALFGVDQRGLALMARQGCVV